MTTIKNNSSKFRLLGDWKKLLDASDYAPVNKVFDEFPKGEVVQYEERVTDEEAREREASQGWNRKLCALREAGEAHRRTRQHIQGFMEAGMPLITIVEELERHSCLFVGKDGLKRGMGFPTGMSVNFVAAHDTPNSTESVKELTQQKILCPKSITKLDFGTHVEGNIIDCAFSIAFDPVFDPLIKATQDATNCGLKMAGPEQNYGEVASAMGEIINSYEMEKEGKLLPVIPIRNLNGHTMSPFKIHAGNSLPFYSNCTEPTRMKEYEIFAIETFASVGGKGVALEGGECSHYMLDFDDLTGKARNLKPSSKALLEIIQSNFSTLAFSQRWLKEACNGGKYAMDLYQLVKAGIVNTYPPLVDTKKSFVSQMEHTVAIGPSQKEVMSRGEDF